MTNIKKHITGCLLAGFFIGFIACTSDTQLEDTSLKDASQLSAVLTKGAGDAYPDLHLMAKLEDNGKIYMEQKAISISTLGETASTIVFDDNSTFNYPLADKAVRLFGYTGVADASGNISLAAGKDILLSNGDQSQDDGSGTKGSSKDIAKSLLFRHIMTQVKIVVKETGDTNNKPVSTPTSFKIKFAGVPSKGSYPITGISTTSATGLSSDSWELAMSEADIKNADGKIFYLIPTGKTLSGEKKVSSLVIDDYEATQADRDKLNIQKLNTDNLSTDLKLLPGLSYTLTFTIERLKVTSVTFTQVPWVAKDINNGDVAYKPQELTMVLGDYDADPISKVILHTHDGGDAKQYVGNCKVDNGQYIGQFVLLPQASAVADSVHLYTNKGLLVSVPLTDNNNKFDSNSNTLTVALSKGGMRIDTNGNYLIESPVQFMNIGKDLANTANYKQMIDIFMDRIIGNESMASLGSFEGTYNGDGKRIANLNLKGCGLFTENKGTLKNIRISSGNITASGDYVGAICGSNTGTIEACINEAQIQGATKSVGGICGNNAGTIVGCINIGNISDGTTVGGICGNNSNTANEAVKACVNIGMLNKTASSHLAGICGFSVSTSNTALKTCYWLTGTAEKAQGVGGSGNGGLNNEDAVNGTDKTDDVSDLSPNKLRDGYTGEETAAQQTVLRLNNAWGSSDYKFVLKQSETGSTWPIPMPKPTSNP